MFSFKKLSLCFVISLSFSSLNAQEVSVKKEARWSRDDDGDEVIELENKVYKRIEEISTIKGPTLYDTHKIDPILRNKISEELEKSNIEIIEYTVGQGESLQIIAEKLYGNKNRWKEIYLLNKETLTKEKIKVGLILKVKER